MTDTKIIARVTQSQYVKSDVTEGDGEDEEEEVDWEMLSPRKDEIRQILLSLSRCRKENAK